MDLANSNFEKAYEYIHDNSVKKTCYLMNHYCYQYFWSHEHLCKRLEFLNEKNSSQDTIQSHETNYS